MSVGVPSSNAVRTSSSDVRRLAAAQAISFAGGSSAYVALTASIYARTGSAVWVAAVAAVSFAVPSLASPLAGALGDRHDRRLVMVRSDLLGAVCFLGLALLSAPAALVGAKAIAALVAAPFFPAAAAAVPRLAPPSKLARANATVSSWSMAGMLVGPLIGGALTALADASAVFLLNAATFLASAVLVGGLPELRPTDDDASGHRGITAGLRLLARDPVLRTLTLGVVLLLLGMGTTLPAEIVRAHEVGVGTSGYGTMIAAWAAGGVLGAQMAGRLLRRRSARLLLVLGSATVALAYLAVAVAPWFGVLLAGLAAGGLAEGLAEVVHLVVIQQRIPDPLLSRVFAARSAVVEQLAYSLPLLYAGFLVERIGAPAAFGTAAGLCALGAAVLTGAPSRLRLAEQPEVGSALL